MPLLLLLVAAVILYFLFKNNSPAMKDRAALPAGAKYAPPLPTSAPAHHWHDGGRYQTDVVVESAYQDAIRTLAGEHGDSKANAKHQAILVPDDLNPYYDKAVAVFIDGREVGYLDRDDALRLRRKLGMKELTGLPTSCDAVVRGGGLWEGKRLSYSVMLDIEPFD